MPINPVHLHLYVRKHVVARAALSCVTGVTLLVISIGRDRDRQCGAIFIHSDASATHSAMVSAPSNYPDKPTRQTIRRSQLPSSLVPPSPLPMSPLPAPSPHAAPVPERPPIESGCVGLSQVGSEINISQHPTPK